MNKYIEYIKLLHRARKYRYREDPGGIAYLLESIKPGDTVLDIGAHKGAYTYYMRKAVGPKGEVFAFEPQDRLYNYLCYLQKSFDWMNIGLFKLALTDRVTETDLFIPDNAYSFGSSPGATLNVPKDADRKMIQSVLTTTLDDICTELNIHPSFLKIDVEGAELAVLNGAITTLVECRPKILVEIEARHVGRKRALQTIQFLKDLRYKGWFLTPHGERWSIDMFDFDIFQNPKDKKNYCNNFVFE